jgi:hypothetical protein
LKLLLDEMHTRIIAEQLRARGHDVEAVTERPALRSQEDSALLRVAALEGRALVTEDASHFSRLFDEMLGAGETTFGLIFTSRLSMPRGRETIGVFIRALDAFLASHPDDDALCDQVVWLGRH